MKICRSKDLQVRTNAAFNLPCMFYYFHCYEEELEADFLEYYVEFCHDESEEIRWCIGKGLHEVIVLEKSSDKNPLDFQEVIEALIKDKDLEVQFSLIQNISETLSALFCYFEEQVQDPDHFCEEALKTEGQLVDMYSFL